MISSSELRGVAAFSDLPEEQISWFLGCAEEAFPKPGADSHSSRRPTASPRSSASPATHYAGNSGTDDLHFA